jgi:hypothetical protein
MDRPLSQSPLPKHTAGTNMSFPTVISLVLEGKKIFKQEWQDKQYYGFMKDGMLLLHKPDGKNYQWILNDGDIKGVDWVVLP